MNIFVAKLNFDTQESELRQAFEEFGQVDSVKIVFDKFTERSKGFGFVEMPNDDEAKAAIRSLNVAAAAVTAAAAAVEETGTKRNDIRFFADEIEIKSLPLNKKGGL